MMPQSHDALARYVFVYGTLRAGGSNDIGRYQPQPERVGNGEIGGTLYDFGAYPGAVLGGGGRIVGEVYRIEAGVEAALDRLEGVMDDGTGEYLKREAHVALGDQQLRCLVYEIHPDRVAQGRLIASGDWFDRASR